MYMRFTENGRLIPNNNMYITFKEGITLDNAVKTAKANYDFFCCHCLPKFRANGFVILDSKGNTLYEFKGE